ncbi:rhodanese domain protein [Bryobacterales bacterium F-183]|nr:rhodanese domain protein [Bryobacterales bacterium F-183]
MNPLEITVAELQAKLAAGEAVHLVDVREPMEHATAAIDGAELIPMNTVPQRLAHLEDRAESGQLVVFCHHGMRSLMVINWLREQGIPNCVSLAGGIDRWSIEADPKVPRY